MNAFVESVHRYISNVNIKQALLINGEWGCGKTYFIKNELMPLNKNSTEAKSPLVIQYAYISLFGIDSAKKLMTRINSELLLMLGKGLSEKNVRSRKKTNKNGSSENSSIIQILQEKFKTIASITQNKLLTDDMCQAIFETWNFKFDSQKRYVLIFDDFERVEIDMDMLMGIINQLVEHNNFRVVIVANTKELDNGKEIAFSMKKEKIIGATLCYKPDFTDTITSIIESLSNTSDEFIIFLNNEIDAISKITEIANVFNARSIQRAIAVFSEFHDFYRKEGISDRVISAVFRGLVLIVLLNNKGYLEEQDFELFTKHPWDTYLLSGPSSSFMQGLNRRAKGTDEKPLPPLIDENKDNALQIIRNYPFETSYPITESIITYLTTGIWNLEHIKNDCAYLKDLTKEIDDAIYKFVNLRFYEYENIQQLKSTTDTICQNIRDGEYQLNLIYRITRAFEAIEVYKLIPHLHLELKKAIIYWKTNTPIDTLYDSHTPLEQHERIISDTIEKPEYIDVYSILDDLYDEVYHRQMVAVYDKESKNLDLLLVHEDMINLLHKPEFIEVVCMSFSEKSISLKNIYWLMHFMDPTRYSFFITNDPDHADNRQCYNSLVRLLTSVKQYVASVDDKLWLCYTNDLQERLQTQIDKFAGL